MSADAFRSRCRSPATAEELRTRFTQAGYYVYSVQAARHARRGWQPQEAKLEAFIIFNQQFLTLIRAGLPILGSLEMLAKGQKNPTFRAQLENVAARVRTGESLSAAFEAQGGFPLIYTTTLLAGERSGNLEEVLARYLAFQRISLTFRKKLMASLLYPALLITHGGGAVHLPDHALWCRALPALRPDRHESARADAAAADRGQQFSALYSLCAVPAFALIVYGLIRGGARPTPERTGSIAFASSMPVFGNIWLKYQVALFARTLSTLLTGGIAAGAVARDGGALDLEQHASAKAVVTSVGQVREGKGAGAEPGSRRGSFPTWRRR